MTAAPTGELGATLDQLLSRIELIQEYVLGRRDYGVLDPATRSAAEPHLKEIFRAFSHAHEAWQRGECRTAVWEPACAAMKSLLRTTLYKDYWHSHRAEFDSDFRARVDGLLD